MAGKHRARTPRRAAGFVVAGGAAVAATSVVAGVAHAEPGMNWEAVAACKSGQNGTTSITSDYVKQPQFTVSPLPACGKPAVPMALVASVAPATTPRHASLAKHAAPAEPATSPPRHAAPQLPAAPATSMTVYTVQAGDTLAQIATDHSIPGGWQRVWDENRDVLVNPDTIAVGERLRIPVTAPAATPPFTESIIHTTSGVIAGITGKPAPTIMLAPAKPATRTAPPAAKPATRTAPPAAKPAALSVKVAGTSGGFAARAVSSAVAQVGTPYRYGGAAPGGFDCSGLVQFAFKRAGISLPRTAAAQATVGKPVSLDNLQPGDLLFYYRPVGHVVVYVGNGKIAEASEPGKPVHVRKLYTNGFVGARRVI
jgi:peptidoglycan DL-endopeptidase CwlO